MVYKHLHHAFFFEVAVGLVTIFAIIAFGRSGLAALVLIAFRPFLLEKEASVPTETIWRLYYNAFRISLILTTVSVILTYIGFELELFGAQDPRLTLVLISPWFLMAHGFIGFVLSKPKV